MSEVGAKKSHTYLPGKIVFGPASWDGQQWENRDLGRKLVSLEAKIDELKTLIEKRLAL